MFLSLKPAAAWLIVATAFFVAETCAWAGECVPIPTRPVDSVRLIRHPVGPEWATDLLEACRKPNRDSRSKFAEATILLHIGNFIDAIRLL
jgi:hypothetical protein